MTDDRALTIMTAALAEVAEQLAKEIGADPALAISALGFAQSKIIVEQYKTTEQRLGAVEAMGQAARQAMADMIAGAGAPNQRLQ